MPYPLLPQLSPGQPLLEFVNHGNRRGIHSAQHGQVPADEIADQYRREQPGQLSCPGRTHLIEPARDNARSLVMAARSASRGGSTASRRMITCSNRARASSRPQPTVSLWFNSGKVFQTANVLAFSLN